MRDYDTNRSRMLYVLQILWKYTDENHPMTIPEIKKLLPRSHSNAANVTIQHDIEFMRDAGADIFFDKTGRSWTAFFSNRLFEAAEVKMLIDMVMSSKSITSEMSEILIKKLCRLISIHEAETMSHVIIHHGIKRTKNKSIYYNIDKIFNAIDADKQIRFEYLKWTPDKKLVPKKNRPYHVSPFSLFWDDKNYYMIGYCSYDEKIKHYRVDKMKNVSIREEARIGYDAYGREHVPNYSEEIFGMFGGPERTVYIRCRNYLAGAIIDQFGEDINIIRIDEEYFEVHVKVIFSYNFLGWVFGLRDAVITGPEDILEETRTFLESHLCHYKN